MPNGDGCPPAAAQPVERVEGPLRDLTTSPPMRLHCLVAATVTLWFWLPPPAAHAAPAGIDFVSTAQWQQQRREPTAGTLKLDLQGLDSVAAAEVLVASWRGRLGPLAQVDCWLAAEGRSEAASAASALLATGCSRVRVHMHRHLHGPMDGHMDGHMHPR